MLEQPCGNCGELLDVNVNVCPHCGTARKRMHIERPVGPLRWLLLPCGALAGAVLAAMAGVGWEAAANSPEGVLEGVACLGGLGGLVVGWLVYRRTPRKHQY